MQRCQGCYQEQGLWISACVDPPSARLKWMPRSEHLSQRPTFWPPVWPAQECLSLWPPVMSTHPPVFKVCLNNNKPRLFWWLSVNALVWGMCGGEKVLFACQWGLCFVTADSQQPTTMASRYTLYSNLIVKLYTAPQRKKYTIHKFYPASSCFGRNPRCHFDLKWALHELEALTLMAILSWACTSNQGVVSLRWCVRWVFWCIVCLMIVAAVLHWGNWNYI